MLWDEHFEPRKSDLERILPRRRYGLAVTAFGHTLESFDPPLPDSPATRILRRCLAQARLAVEGAQDADLTLPEDAAEVLGEVLEEGGDAGVGPLVLGLFSFFGDPNLGLELPVENLHNALYQCYEAVFEREEETEDLPTVEDERANPRCAAAVEWQLRLIDEALAES